MKRALVLYIPILHAGYIRLFEKYRGEARVLFIFGPDLIKTLTPLHKEIRALPPVMIKKMTESLGYFPRVEVLSKKNLGKLKGFDIITADEEISRNFVKKYIPRASVAFERIFLRWDEKNVQITKPLRTTQKSISAFDKKMMARLVVIAQSSSDWWRQVGAVIAKNGKVLIEARNRHVPSDHMPYIDGDPRDSITAGKNPELSTALHAEQSLIAEAAKRGVKLQGANIYVSAFPCPVCAKLIAYSGIKKCFFGTGSATLDGERVLKTNGVRIIHAK